MDTPIYSVIVPLYNKGNYIERTIKSVLNQTFDNFEIIIVDDGSTDDGPDKVKAFSDPRIHLIRKENGGVSSARNRGIQESAGQYVAFLDADDYWLDDFLLEMDKLIMRYPNAGVYGADWACSKAGVICYDKVRILEGFVDYFKSALVDCVLSSSSTIVKHSCFKDVGVFNERLSRGEDLDMWERLALKFPVVVTDKILAIYCEDASGRTCSTHVDFQRAYLYKSNPIKHIEIGAYRDYLKKWAIDLSVEILKRGQLVNCMNFLYKHMGFFETMKIFPRCFKIAFPFLVRLVYSRRYFDWFLFRTKG